MSGGCCAALVFIFLALLYLLQLVVAVFVLPINIDCSFDTLVPDSAPVNLSMEDWIMGGMFSGIIMLALFISGSRGKESDCAIILLLLFYFLYNLFVFVWCIIGLIIYNNYYGQVCSQAQNYSTLMNLSFYSGLVSSSLMIIVFVTLCCVACRDKPQTDQKIQKDDTPENENASSSARDPLSREKIRSIVEDDQPRQEEIINDAEFQRRRNLYDQLKERLLGD